MTEPVRLAKTPRYVEILEALQAEIVAGDFAVGTLLPSEASLCERFNVSRFTVREALRRLQADGMVSRIQGAGSRVLRDTQTGMFVQDYRSMSELTQYAVDTELELITVKDTVLSADLAGHFGRQPGETWVQMLGLRRSPEGAPLALVESYVPDRFRELAPELAVKSGPIYAGLAASIGETVDRVDQETQALGAPGYVADVMGLTSGAPVLRILRRYTSASGLLIASFNWHYGGDRYIHRTRIMLERD